MKSYFKNLTFWQAVAALALLAGLYATYVRFRWGLGAATNLSDAAPWGLWIGFDVLVGVGLAGGGFAITATVHLFNLERFRPIVRPTLLTAFLGYLIVIAGLLFDLGRPYRIWHPLVMWNPHSVMFEVAWCVTLYTTVLALEFSPMVLERFRLRTPLRIVGALTVPLVIAGVLLSTLHQSSLGTLYVIIPQKLHGLWYSSLLPVLFFLSAIAAGLSMVILESFLSARAFGRHLELDILQDLGRVVVVVLALYIVIRLQNLASREAFSLLLQPGPERFLFGVEVGFGALVPGILLALPAVRRDRGGLFCAALLVVLGFVLNRLNVAITGLGNGYFPSALELAVTGMLVALSFIAFSLAVKHLQVFPQIPLSTVSSGPLPRPAWVAPITRGALASLGITMLFGALWLNFSGIPLAAAPRPQIEREYTPELRLPSDQVFPAGEDSPGRVLFSHESHADTDKPNCVVCHTGAFSILREERASGYRYGDQMHEKTRCGLCHNNEDAFEVEDNCEVCHVGD